MKNVKENEYIGSDVEYEQEEKKFIITRGMVILISIALVVIIIIIILIKSLFNKGSNEKYTKLDFEKLEQRMSEEAPIYINQKNIVLTEEKIKINLDDLLTTNGGSIDPEKNKVVKICKGYVIAYKNEISYYNSYISCGDKYTTDGYEKPEKSTTKITKTTTYKDDVKPNILIIGESKMTIYVGDTYKEPGFTATDNIDGDITSDVKIYGSVNTSKAGTYNLKYKVSDKAGNTNEIERIVIVVEKQTTTKIVTNATTKKTTTTRKPPENIPTTTNRIFTSPTIILLGQREITLYKGDKYNEPGYIAKDALGSDITSRVNITGSVDTSKAGVYNLKYSVTDKYGNSFSINRIITVKDSYRQINVDTITLTPNSAFINVGTCITLNVGITPSNATDKTINWSSSDIRIATVSSNGTVCAIKRGIVTITAFSSNGRTATSQITIN